MKPETAEITHRAAQGTVIADDLVSAIRDCGARVCPDNRARVQIQVAFDRQQIPRTGAAGVDGDRAAVHRQIIAQRHAADHSVSAGADAGVADGSHAAVDRAIARDQLAGASSIQSDATGADTSSNAPEAMEIGVLPDRVPAAPRASVPELIVVLPA